MEKASDIIARKVDGPPGTKFSNERQELVQRCVDEINRGREGTKYAKVTWGQINGKLAHVKGWDLSWFVRECEKADNFSRLFYGKLRKKQ